MDWNMKVWNRLETLNVRKLKLKAWRLSTQLQNIREKNPQLKQNLLNIISYFNDFKSNHLTFCSKSIFSPQLLETTGYEISLLLFIVEVKALCKSRSSEQKMRPVISHFPHLKCEFYKEWGNKRACEGQKSIKAIWLLMRKPARNTLKIQIPFMYRTAWNSLKLCFLLFFPPDVASDPKLPRRYLTTPRKLTAALCRYDLLDKAASMWDTHWTERWRRSGN